MQHIKETLGHLKACGRHAKLGSKLVELLEAVAARKVRRHVDFTVCMAHLVDRGQTTIRLLKLEVEPLHLLVVGTVVKQHLDRRVRVRDEVRPAAARQLGENEDAADDSQELKLRDRERAQTHRNGHRKEEAMAPATKARGDGAVLGRVRVSEETAKQGLGGVGRRRRPQGR